jgi:hypothetical protein
VISLLAEATAYAQTPQMLADHIWSIEEIVGLLETRERKAT